MISMKSLVFIILLFCPAFIFAQANFSWHEPTRIEGICVTDSQNIFHRLPAYMQEQVRKPVWDLSLHTAGEFIYFKTTARNITVRFVLAKKGLAMSHMPATGVSGVDLYAVDRNGAWNWAWPRFTFGDTATFQYTNLFMPGNRMADFYLYLPLYNEVKWL